MKILIKHFDGYKSMRPWPFCLKITFESFLVALIFGLLFMLMETDKRSDVDINLSQNVLYIVISIGVFTPIFETLLLQSFPVFIVRSLKDNFTAQLVAAWIPFALLHFLADIQVGVCAGLIRGFYLAYTYVHWIQSSRWTAFWTTSVSHMITNFIRFFSQLVGGKGLYDL